MALPFSYFFLSRLQTFGFSCLDSMKCGNIEIEYPFFSSTNAAETASTSKGNYSIKCNYGFKPTINFNGHENAVKRISSWNKVFVLQDVGLGHSLLEGRRGFLYNFTDPIHNFDLPLDFQLQSFNYSSLDCSLEVHVISRTLFPVLYDSVPCKDYNLYYWNESAAYQSEAVHQPNCQAGKPYMFEWVLSFGAADGSLSLLAAGFSLNYEKIASAVNRQERVTVVKIVQ